MNDEALIAAYYAGNDGALGELLRRYNAQLVRVFVTRGLSSDEADDAAQTMWMNVIRTKENPSQQFDQARGVPFIGWLTVIAQRVAVDLLRKRGRAPAPMPASGEGTVAFEDSIEGEYEPVDAGLLSDELRDAIQACVGELPEGERDVLELEMERCVLEPKPTQQEWAKDNELTLADYTARLHRARRKMAECLRRRMPDGPRP